MKAVILAGGLGSRLSQETVLKPVDEGHLLTYHRDNFWHTWTVYEIARRWRPCGDRKRRRGKSGRFPLINNNAAKTGRVARHCNIARGT